MVKKCCFVYGVHSPLSDEVLNHMAKFDLVVTEFDVASDIPKLKALNPNVAVLGYNSPWQMRVDYPDWAEVDQHEDWFIHDLNGARLQINWSSGWYAMDFTNSEWRNYLIDKLQSKIVAFDGVFLDNIWSDLNRNAWRVDASLVPDVANDVWQNFMRVFLSEIKSALVDKGVVTNSYPETYIDDADGTCIENFGTSIRSLEVLESIGRAGKVGIVIAKQNCKQTFALFLLAAIGNRNYYSYWFSPQYCSVMDSDVGVPSGDRFEEAPSIWVRNFTNVKVYANASTQPYTFTFEDKQYTIQPNTAMILTFGGNGNGGDNRFLLLFFLIIFMLGIVWISSSGRRKYG